MAEVLVELMQSVTDEDGRAYGVLACGAPTDIGTWHGWLEFVSTDGTRLRSPRETTQPSRAATIYWATGLTGTFIEGSFDRARTAAQEGAGPKTGTTGARRSTIRRASSTANDTATLPHAEAVLDPFSVYGKGEAVLRRQLKALSPWHLVNIISAYRLSDLTEPVLNELPGAILIDLIVDGVAARE